MRFVGVLSRIWSALRGPALEALPTLPGALERLGGLGLGIRSIICIGAGRGGDTCEVAQVWPGARTLLVDMDARFAADYRALSLKQPEVSWVICGAAAEDREGAMLKSNDVGGAIVTDIAGDRHDLKPVLFRRIDTLVEEYGLEPPYFLRLDTHGVEQEVMRGAEATLEKAALVQIEVYNFKLNFVRQQNFTFAEMVSYMQTKGFRVVDLCDPLYRSDGVLWQMHLFFARSDLPAFKNHGFSVAARSETRAAG